MTLPIVHLNGTGARSLTEDYLQAANAIGDAIEKVQAAGPNMRDYYCSPDPLAFEKASQEHWARIQKLVEVKDALNAIAEHCSNFIKS